jgi:hypothetical protein
MHDVSMLPSCGELMMSGMKPSEAAELARHIEACSMDARRWERVPVTQTHVGGDGLSVTEHKLIDKRIGVDIGELSMFNETGRPVSVTYDSQSRAVTIR